MLSAAPAAVVIRRGNGDHGWRCCIHAWYIGNRRRSRTDGTLMSSHTINISCLHRNHLANTQCRKNIAITNSAADIHASSLPLVTDCTETIDIMKAIACHQPFAKNCCTGYSHGTRRKMVYKYGADTRRCCCDLLINVARRQGNKGVVVLRYRRKCLARTILCHKLGADNPGDTVKCINRSSRLRRSGSRCRDRLNSGVYQSCSNGNSINSIGYVAQCCRIGHNGLRLQ